MSRKDIRRINGKEYLYSGTYPYREQAEEAVRDWRDQGFAARIIKRRIGETTVYNVYVCLEE